MSNFFQPAGGGTPSDGSVTIAKLDATTTTQADDLKNLTLATSVGSNALTIALKTKGGTDASASDPITIGMRNATSSTGTYNQRQVTGSLSLVISSGSTLGHVSAIDQFIFVYAIDNSGTIELAASSKLFDDGSIVTTLAEGGAGGADSSTAIYSTTARSNVPLRFIGRLKSNQATAGTWASNMAEIAIRPSIPVPRASFIAHTSTTAATSSAPFVFSTEVEDTYSAYNVSTGVFTCPRTGAWAFGAGTYSSGIYSNFIYKNGASVAQGSSANAAQSSEVYRVLSLVAGDTVEIRPGSNQTATGGEGLNFFYGFLLKD